MNRLRATLTPLLLLIIASGIVACERYELEVQNETDEVIDIYVDEFYEGAIAPENYLIIRGLSRGEHYIEAFDLDEELMAEDYIYLDSDHKLIIYESHYRFY